jgi:hypothetical protein
VNVHLTIRSSNSKTGPIPVSTLSRQGCPDTCQLKGSGCYAESGPLALHWNKVSNGDRGYSWTEYCRDVESFPAGSVHRVAQAGDLPHQAGTIDRKSLARLARASQGKLGIAYTHHAPSVDNVSAVRSAASLGLVVNWSANNVGEAEALFHRNIGPVVTVLPSDHKDKVVRTLSGVRIVTCPAETTPGVPSASKP